MSFLGYILVALAKVIGLIINLYTMVIIVSALISWVNPDPYNPIVRILNGLTEPVYRHVRRFMPRALFRHRIDFTPIFVLVLLMILETVLTGVLYDAGRSLLQ